MVKKKGRISDAKLIASVKQGDEQALEEIVQRYSSKVYNLAFHLTRDESAAEEIMQEVFLTVVSKIETLTNNAYFSTWLYRVTTNAAYGYLRRERKYSDQSSVEDLELDIPPDYDWSVLPDHILLSAESKTLIRNAIDTLPESMKTVVVMKDIEGLKNEEIAQSMGLSVPAVKSRLHRGRLILRRALSDYFSRYAESTEELS